MVKIYIFFMQTLKLSQECQLLNTNIDCLNKFLKNQTTVIWPSGYILAEKHYQVMGKQN